MTTYLDYQTHPSHIYTEAKGVHNLKAFNNFFCLMINFLVFKQLLMNAYHAIDHIFKGGVRK